MASVPRGNPAYATGPFRSREGLSSRSNPQTEQLQLRIDPIHDDLDEEIDGLRHKVSQLKNIAQEIESEARFQNGFIGQLEMTMIKAQAGVKNNLRRLNRNIIQQGSNHVMHLIIFGLLLFFILYLLSKVSGR
uniref:t-SNARE coiled-coil homology domain-containing protein n=1 Tax=Picea sitchensis TaxID=3332 RepID=B8LME3_PICSI|nr:unknown [Picea sitchensis]